MYGRIVVEVPHIEIEHTHKHTLEFASIHFSPQTVTYTQEAIRSSAAKTVCVGDYISHDNNKWGV